MSDDAWNFLNGVVVAAVFVICFLNVSSCLKLTTKNRADCLQLGKAVHECKELFGK